MVTGTKPHEGLSGAASYALNADAVAELIDERDGETANGLAPATVNRWLAQIIAILNVALRRGWIDKLPVIDHRPQPPDRCPAGCSASAWHDDSPHQQSVIR